MWVLDSGYSLYILDVRFGSILGDDTASCTKNYCRDPVYHKAHTLSTRSISYTPSSPFQDFTLPAAFRGFHSVRGSTDLLGEYFARICCSISRFETLDILRVLAIFGLQ